MSRWPRIRTKIFLREDIWYREIHFDDKAKVRDGIDRVRITWDAPVKSTTWNKHCHVFQLARTDGYCSCCYVVVSGEVE